MTNELFQRRTSTDDVTVSLLAQEKTFKDIPQRILVSTNAGGLSSFSCHLTMQQAEELADALMDALEWVRAIPHRKAEAEAAEARETAELEEDAKAQAPRQSLPNFLVSASL